MFLYSYLSTKIIIKVNISTNREGWKLYYIFLECASAKESHCEKAFYFPLYLYSFFIPHGWNHPAFISHPNLFLLCWGLPALSGDSLGLSPLTQDNVSFPWDQNLRCRKSNLLRSPFKIGDSIRSKGKFTSSGNDWKSPPLRRDGGNGETKSSHSWVAGEGRGPSSFHRNSLLG